MVIFQKIEKIFPNLSSKQSDQGLHFCRQVEKKDF